MRHSRKSEHTQTKQHFFQCSQLPVNSCTFLKAAPPHIWLHISEDAPTETIRSKEYKKMSRKRYRRLLCFFIIFHLFVFNELQAITARMADMVAVTADTR
jgi:hypothetical protein